MEDRKGFGRRPLGISARIGFAAMLLLVVALWQGTGSGAGSGDSPEENAGYVGPKKCRTCHVAQYKSWAETKMSKAFELLKPGVRPERKKAVGLDPDKDYTADTTCVPCHTTGYGKPGGFVSEEETPKMVGVTCEMCHGPGKAYLRKGFMTLKNKNFKRSKLVEAGLVIPNASTCTSLCHNEKNPFYDPKKPFNWEERKAKGTHVHKPLKYKHD